MIMTDGTKTVYGVFRGPVKLVRQDGERVLAMDLHRAEQLASYTVEAAGGDVVAMAELMARLTARHATIEAPAIEWQRKEAS